MPKCCEKCGTHYIGLYCPGCLRAVNAELVEALEGIMSMIDDGNALDETWNLQFAREAIARARG